MRPRELGEIKTEAPRKGKQVRRAICKKIPPASSYRDVKGFHPRLIGAKFGTTNQTPSLGRLLGSVEAVASSGKNFL
jgi:hypothetical protein